MSISDANSSSQVAHGLNLTASDSSVLLTTYTGEAGETCTYDASGHNLNQPHKKEPCKAYSTVAGGFIYNLFLGAIYCVSVISTYLQSYYEIPKDKNFSQDLLPAF